MKIWILMTLPFLMMVVAAGLAFHRDFNDAAGDGERSFAGVQIERVTPPFKEADLSALKRGLFMSTKPALSAVSERKIKEGRGPLEITLIVISDKKSIAVVDGRFVSAGDSINGFRVKKIEKERILFAGRDKFWRIMEKIR